MSTGESPLRDRMIFLVGARRSGTYWLQRVVGAHPDVALVPSETYLFSRGVKQLRERLHQGVLGSPGTSYVYMDERQMVHALRDLCDKVFLPFLEAAPGRTRLAERTPEHVTCLDVIGEIYPDAWVVHIVRDGRDVARSLIGQPWENAPQSIAEAAEEWRASVESGESAGRALARYRTLHYEDLLADPGKHLADLFRWLELDASDAAVSAALSEAEVRFNQDPDAPTVGAGKWRQAFSDADLAAFSAVAGEALSRLGYEAGRIGGDPVPAEPKRRRRRLLRSSKATGEVEPALQRSFSAQVTETQRLLDRVVAALVTRRLDRLRDMAAPTVWLRVVDPSDTWKGRGEAAWEKLIATVQNDPALDGKQIDGDLHAAIPTSTAVMTFAAPDGSLHVRMVAMSVQQGKIERLVYYRYPVVAAT